MNKCPQCGHPRQAEEYRCQACGAFFSQLDEFLAAEAAEKAKNSFQGRLKAIIQADSPTQAFYAELNAIRANTPGYVFFTWFVIFVFVFALIITVI